MYVDHFGLTGAPFQLTPDAGFWFESASHGRAMAYLGYGLNQAEGFIVVTGPVGAGKTTLMHHLVAQLDPARYDVVVLVTSQVADGDLLRLIAQGLNLPTEGAEKAHLLSRIERRIIDGAHSGRHVLLIVDEAQALTDSALEELRMLSNFQIGGRATIQILLMGQSEFRDRIRPGGPLEQLRQRVIAQHHLEPMTDDEVWPYLEHRLRRVGWQGNPQITPDACAVMHRESGGIARLLNMIATRAMLMAAVEDQNRIDAGVVAAVVDDLSGEILPAPSSYAPAAPDQSYARAGGGEASTRDRFTRDHKAEPQEAVANHPARRMGDVRAAARIDDWADRVEALEVRLRQSEARMGRQEVVIERLLSMLVGWVEGECPPEQSQKPPERGSARQPVASGRPAPATETRSTGESRLPGDTRVMAGKAHVRTGTHT